MLPTASDIRNSRFYQDVAEEVTKKSKLAEKREIAAALLRKKMSPKLIAEVTGLSQEEIRSIKKTKAPRA